MKTRRADRADPDARERLYDGPVEQSGIRHAGHPLQLFVDDHAEFDYEYDLPTRKSELIKQQEIPSGHDKTNYETTRVWATARDGVKVPVSIVMKKGTKLDGKAPMLLYAYGSYGCVDDAELFDHSSEPRRSRNDLCDRAYSRRQRAWREMAAGRANVQKDEYL